MHPVSWILSCALLPVTEAVRLTATFVSPYQYILMHVIPRFFSKVQAREVFATYLTKLQDNLNEESGSEQSEDAYEEQMV